MRIVYFASSVFVDNDPMMPLVLALADGGASVEVVFQDRFSFECVKAAGTWWRWLQDL